MMAKVVIEHNGHRQEIEAIVDLHSHRLDGSQLIVLTTLPRKEVRDFLSNEMVVRYGGDDNIGRM